MKEYQFKRKDVIQIRKLVHEIEENIVKLQESTWKFNYNNTNYEIRWLDLKLSDQLIHQFKGYLASRLESVSPPTAGRDIRLILFLDSIHYQIETIDSESQDLIRHITFSENQYYALKAFFKWSSLNVNKDLYKEKLKWINTLKPRKSTPYSNIRTINCLSFYQKSLLIKKISSLLKSEKHEEITRGLTLLISFELGLRPIQIYVLDIEDFNEISEQNQSFYSLNILNSKKVSNRDIFKKKRAISKYLGEQIKQYIQGSASILDPSTPLLVDKNGRRLISAKVSSYVNRTLSEIGLDTKMFNGIMPLRHNLAQSLADQGSPAEVISEILGHNSTIAAKAYIAATPKIAEIKSRALGKSERFKEVLKMLETGEPREKDESNEERWVQGIVGDQYIGGIGECGLPSHNPCPKNPVYSCYTCQKFHPFKDGPHTQVLRKLRDQAQLFIDNSAKSGDLRFNRTLEQLELTIESVSRTINLFNH